MDAQTPLEDSSKTLADGRAALRRGDLPRAQRLLEQVVQQNPNSPDASFLLGVAYLRLGQIVSAELQLQRAVVLRPNYPKPTPIWAFCMTNRASMSNPAPLSSRRLS